MTVEILLVCRANICRSPTLELRLGHHLRALGIGHMVKASSAGTAAEPGRQWCQTAASWSGTVPGHAEFQHGHSSRRLTPGMIAGADLILTADQLTRGRVVHDEPSARAAVFTLVEGAVLASAVLKCVGPPDTGSTEPPLLQKDRQTIETRLLWLFEEMDASRGLVSLGQRPPTTRWRRRPRRHSGREMISIDILDPHEGNGADHEAPLGKLAQACDAFARTLKDALSLAHAPD